MTTKKKTSKKTKATAASSSAAHTQPKRRASAAKRNAGSWSEGERLPDGSLDGSKGFAFGAVGPMDD